MSMLGVSFAAARRPTNVFSQGTRNLIAALKAAGVRRLIVQSSFGVGDSRRDAGLLERVFYTLLLRGAYADKVLQEQVVRESGFDYTIVRSTRLTTDVGTGRYTARVGPGPVPSSIARADVARFILDALATSGRPLSDPSGTTDVSLDVQAALRTLVPDQRAALVLVDMLGYSVADAADVLGVSEGTVKSRAARGRAKLLPRLAHLGPGGIPPQDRRNQSASGRVLPAREGGEGS